jgi:hypothetical protein
MVRWSARKQEPPVAERGTECWGREDAVPKEFPPLHQALKESLEKYFPIRFVRYNQMPLSSEVDRGILGTAASATRLLILTQNSTLKIKTVHARAPAARFERVLV